MKSIVNEFLSDNFIMPNKKYDLNNASVKKRIEFLDLVKGVCIILIVLFHCGACGDFAGGVLALSMPPYFVISGIFFKADCFKHFFEKKINRLLIPLVFFFSLGILVHWLHFRSLDHGILLDPIISDNILNYPIWFLICLFWINMIYGMIYLYLKPMFWRFMTVCAFGTLGYLMSVYGVHLPLFLGSAFSSLPFFFIGILIRKLPLLYPNKYTVYELVAAIVILCAGLGYATIYDTPHFLFRSNVCDGNLLEVYLLSISLMIGLFLLCKCIRWLPIVSFVGRYSLLMLGLHGLVISVLFYCNPMLDPIMISVITLSICWLAIPFMIRYFPRFTAQKDLIHLPRRKQKVEVVEYPETVEALERVEEEKS